jgi:hypothetical protein
VLWLWATECENLKKAKGKAYNATLSDESEKEEDQEDLHYSEHSDEKLKEEYCVLYTELMKLRESNQKKVMRLNTMKDKKRHITSKGHGLGR